MQYNDDGSLILSRVHEAVDPQLAAENCLRVLKEGRAPAASGKMLPMHADCICVHSDTPGAVELARVVHDALRPYL